MNGCFEFFTLDADINEKIFNHHFIGLGEFQAIKKMILLDCYFSLSL